MNGYENIDQQAKLQGWTKSTHMPCAHGLARRQVQHCRCREGVNIFDHRSMFIQPDKSLVLLSWPYLSTVGGLEKAAEETRNYADRFALIYSVNDSQYDWYYPEFTVPLVFWATEETYGRTEVTIC